MYSLTKTIFDYEFHISVNPAHAGETLELSCDLSDLNAHTKILNVCVKNSANTPLELRSIKLCWQVPATDMHGLYFGGNPLHELGYLPFHKQRRTVSANTGLPFIALCHRDATARAAFGLLDQLNEVTLHSFLDEETRCYHFEINKPGTTNGQTLMVDDTWEEQLFVFTQPKTHGLRQATWFEVLGHYRNWVDAQTNPALMPVPEAAFDPVFCSWTAIHHDVNHEWLMRNLTIAKDLGFKTLITDDGWFLPSGEGLFGDYRYVGDWTPEVSKFPDFSAHVAAVKALGFRYLLWIAPFMIGYNNTRAETYAHLFTTGQEKERFHNLSPWKNETRDIISSLLTTLLKTYDLDGFKLDFIDAVKPTSERTENSSKDTLGQKIFETLQHVMNELQQHKPGLLIEFRNTYTNLASRSYSNLYRSSDVPINPGLNRWQATLLRLLAPDRAVHTDPGLWHPDDSDENVAVHLINLLAAVPMVSVELDTYPQSHLALLRNWIGFYNTHRNTLAHGRFEPVLSNGTNPVTYFHSEQETIIALYDTVPVTLKDATRLHILNASPRTRIYLSEASATYKAINKNKFGQPTKSTLISQTHVIDVEIGGSIELSRVKDA